MALDNAEVRKLKDKKPAEICRQCITEDYDINHYNNNDWEEFNALYCVTECSNNHVPNHIPQEQVIKYLKKKNTK